MAQMELPFGDARRGGFEPRRAEPVIWVSRLLVLREPRLDAMVRDIRLRRGLNILWAQPAPGGEARLGEGGLSGHTAGKTTFCRFLRYLLGEQRFAAPRVQERIRTGALRDGWVVGEVFVNGEPWVVGRPFALHVHPFATRGVSIEEAIARPGPYQDYTLALGDATVSALPARQLPATARPIDWPLLLTWLTRDQEARFAAVEEWRSPRSESDSPSPPAIDRATVVRSVLDVVSDDEAALQRQWEELDRVKEDIDRAGAAADVRGADRRRRLAERLSLPRDMLDDGELFVQAAAAEVEQLRREAGASRAKAAELRAEAAEAEAAKDDAARAHAELAGQLKLLQRRRDARTRASQPIPGAAVSGRALSGEPLFGGAVSGGAVSGGAVSGGAVSGGAVSGESVSGESVSGELVSGESVSGSGVSGLSRRSLAGEAALGPAVPGRCNVPLAIARERGCPLALDAAALGALLPGSAAGPGPGTTAGTEVGAGTNPGAGANAGISTNTNKNTIALTGAGADTEVAGLYSDAPADLDAEIAATEAAMERAAEALREKKEALAGVGATLADIQARAASKEAAAREAEGLLQEARAAEREASGVEERRRERAARMADVSERRASLRRTHAEALRRLSDRFDEVLRALLGEQVKGRVDVTRDGVEPVAMAQGDRESAALDTIKVLAFDLAALSLGFEGHGRFPGFLVHDGPREADMDQAVYDRLFLYALQMEEAFSAGGGVGFQYIVTTTTPPPERLRRAPWLLDPVLDASVEEGRLLRMNL